jgi:cytochrome c biogenesis protein CcdA
MHTFRILQNDDFALRTSNADVIRDARISIGNRVRTTQPYMLYGIMLANLWSQCIAPIVHDNDFYIGVLLAHDTFERVL